MGSVNPWHLDLRRVPGMDYFDIPVDSRGYQAYCPCTLGPRTLAGVRGPTPNYPVVALFTKQFVSSLLPEMNDEREEHMANPDNAHGVRGSQKLLERLARNGDVPNVEEIKKALQLPAAVKIPNWLIRGLPPVYLELEGTLEVPIAQVNEVVGRFVALNDSAINLKIFINGTPIPDIAQIVVRNTPGEE
jgi:hypothetical protein